MGNPVWGERQYDEGEKGTKYMMRQWLKILDRYLSEGREIFDVNGNDVPVLINPNRALLSGLLANAEYSLVRGFATEHDIYFWDASLAIHHQIWRQVTSGPAQLFMASMDYETLVDDAEREWYGTSQYVIIEDETAFFYTHETAADDLMHCRSFEKMFPRATILPDETPKRMIAEHVERFEVRNREILVHVDPTARAVAGITDATRQKMVRGFVYDNHVYVWDAAKAIHQQIWSQITADGPSIGPFMVSASLDDLINDTTMELGQPGDFLFFQDEATKLYLYVMKSRSFVLQDRSFKAAFKNLKPVIYR